MNKWKSFAQIKNHELLSGMSEKEVLAAVEQAIRNGALETRNGRTRVTRLGLVMKADFERRFLV